MGLYVVDAKAFKNSKKRINKKYKIINIDHFERNDIDYEDDFTQASALAEYFKRNKYEQYYEGIETIYGKLQ